MIVLIIDLNTTREDAKANGATFPAFDLNTNVFSCYCLSLFSVVNQFSVVNVLSEYNNPTQRRITKVRNFKKITQ